jgi:hypothetical protein
MMRFPRPVPAAFVLLLSASVPALAHHGWSGYETTAAQTLTGSIERAETQGPHARISLRAADKVWEVVLSPPSRMRNRGLDPAVLKPGETVQVYGYPHRSSPAELRAEWIKVGAETAQLR